MDTISLTMILSALGGLGLFLLGMIVMTDNLHKLAGDQLRASLIRFTRTPTTGAITGAIATALVQSSSATTVAAVGFVGAGLMSFSNALGIIFGANIGTTMTGWLVALLGFKLSLSTIMLPAILAGVMIRFFLRGKWRHIGLALAGFGLIFVGIDAMKDAMSDMRDFIDFSQLPADTLLAQLKLLFLGIIFTVITQSSSAGVAVTLTALYAGMIQFEQAAALVIGMDVGTTVTSALASIGGTTDAKRTGFSHVIYNFMTAVLALMLIQPYIMTWEHLAPGQLIINAEMALVGFHTLFNSLGVFAILPFAQPFSRFIKKLFPKHYHLRDQLDPALIKNPPLALTAVQKTMTGLTQQLLTETRLLLSSESHETRYNTLDQLLQDLTEIQTYLDQIHLEDEKQREWARLVHLIHVLDHLQRLHERCEEDTDRARVLHNNELLDKTRQTMLQGITKIQEQLVQHEWQTVLKTSKHLKKNMKRDYTRLREEVIEMMGHGDFDADLWDENLKAIRWARRVSEHVNKITHHLHDATLASGK